jgi:glyoxylase-like metal-dependent hydrolase (beta-lactamase superfamily II)
VRVERVLAPNPGPFTGPGTNTYVVSDGREAVILDPGPLDRGHETAIVETVGDRRVVAVVVTHTHPDHAPLANPLARELGTDTAGYAPGPDFAPDRLLREGDVVQVGDVALQVVFTPGHSSDHVCFRAGGVVFTGDHVLGPFPGQERTSVMVEDLAAYLESLEKILRLTPSRLYPGHGSEVDDPVALVSWYVRHRLEREREILAAVAGGASTVGEVVEEVYREVDPALFPMAARSVEAHLRKLSAEGRLTMAGEGWDARIEATR